MSTPPTVFLPACPWLLPHTHTVLQLNMRFMPRIGPAAPQSPAMRTCPNILLQCILTCSLQVLRACRHRALLCMLQHCIKLCLWAQALAAATAPASTAASRSQRQRGASAGSSQPAYCRGHALRLAAITVPERPGMCRPAMQLTLSCFKALAAFSAYPVNPNLPCPFITSVKDL